MKMGYKKQVKILFVILITTFTIVAYLGFVQEFIHEECLKYHKTILRCIDVSLFSDYQPHSFIVLSTLITLIPLYFTKEAVYKAWRKFAVIYLPIAIFLIIIGDTSGGGGGLGGPSMDMDREMATFFFSGLFIFISFILIIYKSLKLRGE